jgi:hypothetical protein
MQAKGVELKLSCLQVVPRKCCIWDDYFRLDKTHIIEHSYST